MKETLEILLQQQLNSSGLLKSKYVLNKLLQSISCIWKRDWLQCNIAEKQSFFLQIESLICSQLDPTSKYNLIGIIFLRTVIDVFSMRSYSEANLPFDFHNRTRQEFEQNYLTKTFLIAHNSLYSLFQIVVALSTSPEALQSPNNESLANKLFLLDENLKLEIEIISWNFTDSFVSNGADYSISSTATVALLSLPDDWMRLLLSIDYLTSVLYCYKSLQIFIKHPSLAQISNSIRLEIRNLLTAISSIQTVQSQAAIFSTVLNLTNNIIQSIDLRPQIVDLEDGGPRCDDLQLFCSIILRLHSNLKLDTLVQMPAYEGTLINLGVTTCLMAGELASIVDSLINSLSSQGAGILRTIEVLPLNSWRREVLSASLDIWTILLDSSSFLDSINSTGNSNIGSRESIFQTQSFQAWIHSTAKKAFEDMFRCALFSYLLDSWTDGERDEGEEEEDIDSRDVDELLSSFCTLGRVCFPDSAALVSAEIRSTLSAASADLTLHANDRKPLELLERFRIAILFISHLCFDNFSELATSVGRGEVPAVSGLILPYLGRTESGGVMSELLATLSALLSFQLSLPPSHPLLSPLLLRLLYRFFGEFISRFVECDESAYSSENWEVLSRFNTVNGISYKHIYIK